MCPQGWPRGLIAMHIILLGKTQKMPLTIFGTFVVIRMTDRRLIMKKINHYWTICGLKLSKRMFVAIYRRTNYSDFTICNDSNKFEENGSNLSLSG